MFAINRTCLAKDFRLVCVCLQLEGTAGRHHVGRGAKGSRKAEGRVQLFHARVRERGLLNIFQGDWKKLWDSSVQRRPWQRFSSCVV